MKRTTTKKKRISARSMESCCRLFPKKRRKRWLRYLLSDFNKQKKQYKTLQNGLIFYFFQH
jgi:hypothetical protein